MMTVNTARPQLVLFDCDGTLVDSHAAILLSMREAFASEALPEPDPHQVRRVVGLPLIVAIEHVLPGRDPATYARLDAAYRASFRLHREQPHYHEPLFDGIVATVDALDAAGYLLGVATGKGHQGLVSTLGRHGLLERFVTLQTADTAPGKPHPGMALQALRETGVDAADAVMIGDTVFDVQMANAAGLRATIGVAWGYHGTDELLAAGAATIAADAGQLPELVAALLAKQSAEHA